MSTACMCVELFDVRNEGPAHTVQKASSHVKLHRMTVHLLLVDTTLA